jgi:hypothetical protein
LTTLPKVTKELGRVLRHIMSIKRIIASVPPPRLGANVVDPLKTKLSEEEKDYSHRRERIRMLEMVKVLSLEDKTENAAAQALVSLLCSTVSEFFQEQQLREKPYSVGCSRP